jgi:predicted nucleic acid-binding Zn ribbon protein
MDTLQIMQTNTLSANQVAEVCGNNEARIFRVARLTAGYWQKESWFIAAQRIADEINAGGDQAGLLQSYIAASAN